MSRRVFIVMAVALLAASCSASEAARPATTRSGVAAPTTGVATDKVVFAGTVTIPGARAFGDPGFHEVVVEMGVVPQSAAEVVGDLGVGLRDVSRPQQTCDRDHPLSGCVTVDWSDFEDRPAVPPGGVFDNRLVVGTTSGNLELFLSEEGVLAAVPDEYVPT